MSRMSCELDLFGQRPRVRRLNHRPVGDRVAIGNAHLAQRAAAAVELADHVGREVQIRIARRHERHEGLAAGGGGRRRVVEAGHDVRRMRP